MEYKTGDTHSIPQQDRAPKGYTLSKNKPWISPPQSRRPQGRSCLKSWRKKKKKNFPLWICHHREAPPPPPMSLYFKIILSGIVENQDFFLKGSQASHAIHPGTQLKQRWIICEYVKVFPLQSYCFSREEPYQHSVLVGCICVCFWGWKERRLG